MSQAEDSANYWKLHLQSLIQAEECGLDSGDPEYEDPYIYAPRDRFEITFIFEGGFSVVGDRSSLIVNLKYPEMLILNCTEGSRRRSHHFPWSRLVGISVLI
jgi:hypothetical protein